MNETKVRILDAAEKLIAEQGADVSLRAITSAAGVNLAAVNYHFQSKEALIDAIVARRIEPVNAQRLEMLEALEREAGDGPLPLEGVLRALVAPLTEMDARGLEHIRPLMGRLYSVPEEFIQRVFDRHLAPIAARFIDALARALPNLTPGQRMWCMMFTVGALIHVLNWSSVLPHISNGLVDPSDSKTFTERLIAFSAAGFRAFELEQTHA
jgi:AcrR family transcriptional regulator